MDQRKLKIARHETGHAVMALKYGQRIQKVSLKEMDSPTGADKYHAFMKLEPVDPTIKFTGERATQKIMISLGGYASEILFYDVANIGGDDLTIAVKTAENMLQLEEFRNLVAELPTPEPSVLDMIEDPKIRSYIDCKLRESVETLNQVKPAIQTIPAQLYQREELSGDEITEAFHLAMQASGEPSDN